MRFSIVLVTYNADINKVKLTLKSVLMQSFKDYEIVVSDDGSEDNHFGEIEEFFAEYNFDNYVLVPHDENQGTVKNLISALEHSKGEYVRDFGPGDLFYAEDSLEKLDKFLKKNPCDISFGLIKSYQINGDKLDKAEFCHPFDIQAYRKKDNRDRILRNLILYGDNICGASFVNKKDVYLDYLNKISKYVKYEEDIYVVLAALEGKSIKLFDRYLVWYETDIGVSTGGNSKFSELLRQDVDNFFNMLFEAYPDEKYVNKRKRVAPFFAIKNLYLRTILRMTVNPGALVYIIISFLERMLGLHKDKKSKDGFMDDDAFWKGGL